MSKINAVCVYCGSNTGTEPIFGEAAGQFGKILAENGVRLVYGGGSVGLMGILADAVLAHGGKATGIIPEFLTRREQPRRLGQELIVTRDMHERKRTMFERADAFVALPGGIGTLEEIFEAWTWAQLGFHHKPCGLLNVGGYFDKLAEFMDRTVEEDFVKPRYREMLVVESDPAQLLARFEAYRPPAVTQWISRDET